MKTIVIITMGGVGQRFNSPTPKQYMEIKGFQVWEYPLKTFMDSSRVDFIVLAVDHSHIDFVKDKIKSFQNISVIEGGNTANESRLNALIYLKSINTSDEDIIIIHDAVRPYLNNKIINDCIETCKQYDVAIPIIPINDCLLETTEKLHAVQTPQAFRFKDIYSSHINIDLSATHLRAPYEIWKEYTKKDYKTYNGDPRCLKITNPEDINLINGLW